MFRHVLKPAIRRKTLQPSMQSHIKFFTVQALHYLVLISEVEETEIFKICLEYWNALASDLYRENPFPSSSPLLIGTSQSQQIPPRRQMYLSVLSKVS